jgi:riboflavin biosynthesis pyrimidine reductase
VRLLSFPGGANGVSPLSPDALDDAALARLYGYPADRGSLVRGNMVGSLDGAATVDGLSGGLSSSADRRVFWLLRGLADVILVGAGTARAEGYRPTRAGASWAALGLRDGRPSTPPLALVSRSLDLDPAAPLIAQAPADARTIVITCAASPADHRAALASVADVIVAGDDSVDLKAALSALAGRGLARVLCEGGPRLLSDVIANGLLNELCLTLAPVLAGPGPVRVIGGSPFPARRLSLAHLLEEDGMLFARYASPPADDPAAAPPA